MTPGPKVYPCHTSREPISHTWFPLATPNSCHFLSARMEYVQFYGEGTFLCQIECQMHCIFHLVLTSIGGIFAYNFTDEETKAYRDNFFKFIAFEIKLVLKSRAAWLQKICFCPPLHYCTSLLMF